MVLADLRNISIFSFACRKIRAVAVKHSVKTHLDGARLWNASVATGISFREYGKNFDSVRTSDDYYLFWC